MKVKIMELRDMTGQSISACEKALIECNGDLLVAKHYLILLGQSVVRRVEVDGELIEWRNEDYMNQAIIRARIDRER